MSFLKRRRKEQVDRRMALQGVPVMHDGVSVETMADGNVRVSMTVKRGNGFFERMRPPESHRSYELDEFGTFVVAQVDGKRTVLDVIDVFEKRFKMSRREVELSVVAFFKLLMQRNVLSVVVPDSSVAPSVGGKALIAVLLTAVICHPLASSGASAIDDVRAITETYGSRSPGSPGNLALEKHVAERFEQSGFENGEIKFLAPVLEPGRLTLDCGKDGAFELDSMHPTLMRPGNFLTNSFETRLVYLGKGEPEDLERVKGIDLNKTIAVMDYDCDDLWMDIYRFGVYGFVFVGTGEYPHAQSVAKVYNTEVSTPRFFIDGESGEKLLKLCKDKLSVPASAVSVPSRWRTAELRDLWVLIPGADEKLTEQVVVFVAPLDATSVVPARSYGAQRAVNLNILLKLLDDFRKERPKYSVMLAAVNAHSQKYRGERILAWHLLSKETAIEDMRDEIGSEMRMARLHANEYGKLHLTPVAEDDRKDLHVMLDILWKLDEDQSKERKEAYEAALEKRTEEMSALLEKKDAVTALKGMAMPELDEVLDLTEFTEAEVRQAIDRAEKETIDNYNGFFAKRGRDPAELAKEKQEDLALFKAVKALSFDQIMLKAKRIKSVFDDEKLFEKWRAHLDESTGRRVYIKTKLQDEFKSRVNRTMEDILVCSDPEKTEMSGEERERKKEELNERRDNLRKVLILFNKLDIGVGRSKTRYRQIAVNDVQRGMLKEVVDKYVKQYSRWHDLHDATVQRDTKAGAVREALGRRKVALTLLLELDGHADRLGLSYEGLVNKDGIPFGGWFTGFGTLCAEVASKIDLPAAMGTNVYVDALTSGGGEHPQHFFALPASAAFYVQAAEKTPTFAVKSAFSDVGALFGPADTVDRLAPQCLNATRDWTLEFLESLLEEPELTTKDNLEKVKVTGPWWSTMIRTYSLEQFTGKTIPTEPIPGCLVTLYESWPPRPPIIDGDIMNCFIGVADDTANTFFYGLAQRRRIYPTAYKMDPDFRVVEYTIDKGRVQSSQQINGNIQRQPRATLPMFECREFVIRDRRDPTLVSSEPIQIERIWPKTAKGRSDPEKFGVHGVSCLSPAGTQPSVGPIAVYLYRRRAEMDQDRLMLITDKKRCVLNSTKEQPEGVGFLTQEELGPDIFRRAAHDMGLLNRSRNEKMQGVVNQLLDEFMDRGERLTRQAEELKAKNDHLGYLKKLYEALGNHVKAYTELQSMNADMLKAVVVYMALLLPFCFFMQKLLFNFPKLEHELAGFSILFVFLFVLFRVVHPAFRMAMCPEAIFIAFVLGAIGLFTTAVLRSRFHEEMTILFRGVSGIGEDVGYGTVGTTATMIGVQNMRRRRVRTTLTTVTIVLVVFTMLAFSSVSREAKPTLVAQSETTPYTGLFYHWPRGVTMDEASCDKISELYSDRAGIRVLRELKRPDPWRLELASDPGKFITIQAISGVPPEYEIIGDSMAIVEGEFFSSNYAREVILSIKAADALGLGSDDVGKARIKLMGKEWLLKGLFDDRRYGLARDLNPNLPIVPLTTARKGSWDIKPGDDELDVPMAEISNKIVDTSMLAIIPEGISRDMGALPRSVSVVFTNQMDEYELGNELRRALGVTEAKFYVGAREPFKLDKDTTVPIKPGVYYVGNSYRTAIGGLAKLIIPLIIAGSIILNTMLGTVYERKSEIAVFNAIGLNPTHIFMFFLAEAFVYSFIGAVGGYLIGQLLTIGLKAAGLISDVNINFSSLMVVYAVLFTMTLVIVSTIYPGYVATRTAVPSGKRKWSMPDHDGQTMNVVFPFIYRERLTYGVMEYIRQFFAPLSDQSLGDTLAQMKGSEERKDDKGNSVLSLKYSLALAPYDLGVTQDVTFTTQYDDVVKSYRLHMKVERVSGRDTNWITVNKPYLERMRKFLIRWRNIDPTRHNWYVNESAKMFDGAPVTRTDQADQANPSDWTDLAESPAPSSDSQQLEKDN